MPLSRLSFKDILFTCPCKKPAAKRSPAPVKSAILSPCLIPHSTTSSPLIATAPFSPLVTTINLPKKVIDLQKNVWGYSNDIETHTVETHVYRLRKKISDTFKDDKFILSDDNGYSL